MTARQDLSLDPGSASRHVLVGLGLMMLGIALFAARRVDWINWWSSWWALALLFVGLARFIWPGETDGARNSRRFGVWLMGVGGWAWASQNHLLGMEFGTSWPLLIILAGVLVVWQALGERAPSRRRDGREN